MCIHFRFSSCISISRSCHAWESFPSLTLCREICRWIVNFLYRGLVRRCLLFSLPLAWTVGKTIKLLMFWHALMLMWRHCNHRSVMLQNIRWKFACALPLLWISALSIISGSIHIFCPFFICHNNILIFIATESQSWSIRQFSSMDLLPDTQNCGMRMRRECREPFSRHRLQKKPLVSVPGKHHGTCVTHVPWCISGSLTCGGGENVPDIPGACATRNFTYLVKGHSPRPLWMCRTG